MSHVNLKVVSCVSTLLLVCVALSGCTDTPIATSSRTASVPAQTTGASPGTTTAPTATAAEAIPAGLDAAHPGEFDLERGANLAHRVFDVLSWHDLECPRADLREMTGLAAPSADTLTRPGGDG